MLRAVFLAILVLTSSLVMAHAGGSRVALVVGVSKYEHAASLANTLNDAKDMSGALKRLGFDVETVLDPSRSELEAAVRRYGDKSAGAEVSVFHYSGHALEANGRNWLLPTTVDINSERNLPFEAVDLNTILQQTDGGAKVSIVFLDACRDNPFVGRIAAGGRSLSRGLARVDITGSGMLLAFATAPGQVALDSVSAGKNSPFTASLLSHLETAGLEVKSLLSRVTKDVVEETKGKQRPWQNSSLEGDFYFVPSPTAVAVPAAPAPVVGTSAKPDVNFEAVFWDSIKSSTDPAEFEAYLAKFPNGAFVELARIRLAALQPKPQPQYQPPQRPPPASNQPIYYGNENYDFHVAPQSTLKSAVGNPTPLVVPGATTVTTMQLSQATQNMTRMIIIDALQDAHAMTIKGAVSLPYAGNYGGFNDRVQSQLGKALGQLTQGHREMPLVFFCEGIRCWESYNAALRARASGYLNVFWFRGGLTAWRAAGLAMQANQ
jgi:PQQ-dependent catabolism-associated CXXCW motif protein